MIEELCFSNYRIPFRIIRFFGRVRVVRGKRYSALYNQLRRVTPNPLLTLHASSVTMFPP